MHNDTARDGKRRVSFDGIRVGDTIYQAHDDGWRRLGIAIEVDAVQATPTIRRVRRVILDSGIRMAAGWRRKRLWRDDPRPVAATK